MGIFLRLQSTVFPDFYRVVIEEPNLLWEIEGCTSQPKEPNEAIYLLTI